MRTNFGLLGKSKDLTLAAFGSVLVFQTQSLLNLILTYFDLSSKGEDYYTPRDCVQKIGN